MKHHLFLLMLESIDMKKPAIADGAPVYEFLPGDQ